MPSLQPRMMAYYEKLNALGYELLALFEAGLELAPGTLKQFFAKDMNSLRLLHYPAQTPEESGEYLGARAHTDTNAFTMLAQDPCGGLEIRNREGEWVAVPPVDGTFVVNVGEVLKVWTDGVFSSTVRSNIGCSGRDRYSIPFFMYPSCPLPWPRNNNVGRFPGVDRESRSLERGTRRPAHLDAAQRALHLRRLQGAGDRQHHARKDYGRLNLARTLRDGVLVAALTLGFALPAIPLAADTPDAVHLAVGPDSITYTPFYLADRLGFFKAEGLNVDFTVINSGATMVAPLGVGQLDVGGGAISAGLYNAVTRGIDIRIVADMGNDPRAAPAFRPWWYGKSLIDSGGFRKSRI